MKEPELQFSKWRKWKYRDRLSDEFEVPEYFGLLGIYLLATPLPSLQTPSHLEPEVIYIGMSSHVTSRLDKSHKVVCQYRKEYRDKNAENLFYSEWLSPWSNLHHNTDIGKSQMAYIYYIERKLIWEYAKKYNKLPKFNSY